MPAIFDNTLQRRRFLQLGSLGAVSLFAGRLQAAADGPPTDRFRLALLSDTHVPGDRINGHRGFNPWENLKRVVPEVIAAAPEAVILNGDAARLEGLIEDYTELKALLEPLAAKAPIHIGLGNHDDRKNFRQVFPPAGPGRAPLANKHVLVLEHPVVRLVVLDSLFHVNDVAGLLGLEQRRWLSAFLASATDRPIALFVHHTFGEGDGDLLDGDRLFELLKPHPQVKAIFYGHSHYWVRSVRQGLHLVNLPAVGYNFRDEDPVGWVDASFDPRGVTLTLHAIGGNATDHLKPIRLDWT